MATGLEMGVEAIDHLALSVDTSDIEVANRLMADFASAGGSIAKLGLEAQSAFDGPEGLSILASEHGLRWVYDGKIKDIGSTMIGAIKNIAAYDHAPAAITMHADTSFKGMQGAQEAAGDITMIGVTLLTDIGPKEAYEDYANEAERRLVKEQGFTIEEAGELVRVRVVMERGRKLGRAGVRGLVSSPKELAALAEDELTRTSFKMIPGTRSARSQSNDQQNVMTPEDAIANGADLLVIGRQYTKAEDKPRELGLLQDEVARGLDRRAA